MPEIRQATLEDANEISNVLIRSITELCAADHLDDPELIKGWIENKSPEHICQWLKEGAHMRLSLANEGIGAVGCYSTDGMIQLLYVAPEARGQGHSSALLQHMENEMRDKGVDAARLVSSKTAQDYYLKQGWEIDGERVVCYTTDGQPMRKQLISSNT